ncbi:hypothetical protein Moror_14759 [Moniliophthora roreri MCA 2997]|uniref:Serine protease inhibitor n=1 Tax=Moniliophthora roreri (strain MCA 2997) TaxID=1381753 RepID=V2X7D2_MONRO|nr:hypothetical protein Moror_14759 [Moniliophthora roreri MCA 2997]
MPLKSGLYYIQNHGEYIGHSDEKSPIPQHIIVLPGGVQAPKWLIENIDLDNNHYIIRIEEPDGSFTEATQVDNKIFVRALKPDPDTWYIIPDEQGGKDSYVITTLECYDS